MMVNDLQDLFSSREIPKDVAQLWSEPDVSKRKELGKSIDMKRREDIEVICFCLFALTFHRFLKF